MMGRTIVPIALALTLLALPAGARQESHERRDRKAEELSQELAAKAHELYCDAVESTRRPRWRERVALRSLRALDYRAREFAEQVEYRGIAHPRTAYELAQLREAVARADARRSVLREGRRSDRRFERVEKLVERLDRRVARAEERRRERLARRDHRRDDRLARHDRDGYLVWRGPIDDWAWAFALRL